MIPTTQARGGKGPSPPAHLFTKRLVTYYGFHDNYFQGPGGGHIPPPPRPFTFQYTPHIFWKMKLIL